MSGRIRVVTDSVSDLSSTLAQRWGIRVVPVYFSLNGQSYRDDGTVDHGWFNEQLLNRHALPQTAAPSVGDFLQVYEQLCDEGAEQIVTLYLDAQLSSLIQHAQRAAEMVEDVSVHILETGQVTMGQGWLVVEAAEAAAQGASVAEIRRLLARQRRRTFVIGALASLDYLQRSGRVGWVKAQIGDRLNFKPLIGYHEGEARLLGRVRTARRAVDWLERWVERAAPFKRLALLHTGYALEALERLGETLAPYALDGTVPTVEAGPVFSTHVGPGAVGIAGMQAEAAKPIRW